MDLSLTCVDLQPDLDYPHWGCTIYAITVKNVIVSGLFMCIAISRCALEINLTTLATDAPGMCRVQLVGIRCGVYAVHQNSLLSPSRRANHAPSADTGRWKLPTRPSRSFMVHFFEAPHLNSLTFPTFLVVIFVAAMSGIQSVMYPSDNRPECNSILFGYLCISLCA